MNRERDLNFPHWLRSAGAHRQAIVKLAEDVRTLKNRGCAVEAMEVEHDAIELILQSLHVAVLSAANRAEVIEILNTSIDFCATHFAEEEGFMRKSGHAHLDAHVAAHKDLLAKFVDARRCASGEGLPLATLDTLELLHDFHEHVETYDRSTAHMP